MEVIRSFIAIELPDELKAELSRLQSRLKSRGDYPAKWVDPYSIHLTLKFLGDVAVDRIGEITEAIEEAAQGVPPFRLEVRGLGVFPSLKRVQVVWVGVTGELDKLARLQQQIEDNMEILGFAGEARPFTAHLTMARIRERALPQEREELGKLVASTTFEATTPIEVNAVNLMKSQLTREGAIYSRIGSIPLRKPL